MRSFKKFPIIPYQSPPSVSVQSSPSANASPPAPPQAEPIEIKPKYRIRRNESNAQIPIGNGGIAEHYYWTQTIKELTVYVDLDFQAKGKDIQCSITPGHLTLSVRGQLILDDDFEEKVCVDESMWTISSDDASLSQVILTLDKSRKTWWKHVLMNDPEIDTSKVSGVPHDQSVLTFIDLFVLFPLFPSPLPTLTCRWIQHKRSQNTMTRPKLRFGRSCLIRNKRSPSSSDDFN
jgi:hypothetical protein